jgi:hypothetical protein
MAATPPEPPDSPAAEDGAPSPSSPNPSALLGFDDEAPSEVRELAMTLAEFVRRAVGVEVDVSPETLPVVDHYVELVRREAALRPAVIELVAPALGAYFGEVLRRAIGGFWQLPSADVHRWRVCSRQVVVAVNPIGVAYDVLFQGAEHDGPPAEIGLFPEDRARVAPRLAALPSVSEGEFYLLSTRLEVLEIVVDALVTQLPPGAREVELDWDDYADLEGAG